MARKIVNKTKTKQQRGNPAWGSREDGTGKSGNPEGRAAEGESWAAVIKRISNMTGPELAAWLKGLQWAKMIGQLPKVTLKELVIARVFVALVNDPTPGLFSALMERAEGKPVQPISGPEGGPLQITNEQIIHLISNPELAAAAQTLALALEGHPSGNGRKAE